MKFFQLQFLSNEIQKLYLDIVITSSHPFLKDLWKKLHLGSVYKWCHGVRNQGYVAIRRSWLCHKLCLKLQLFDDIYERPHYLICKVYPISQTQSVKSDQLALLKVRQLFRSRSIFHSHLFKKKIKSVNESAFVIKIEKS